MGLFSRKSSSKKAKGAKGGEEPPSPAPAGDDPLNLLAALEQAGASPPGSPVPVPAPAPAPASPVVASTTSPTTEDAMRITDALLDSVLRVTDPSDRAVAVIKALMVALGEKPVLVKDPTGIRTASYWETARNTSRLAHRLQDLVHQRLAHTVLRRLAIILADPVCADRDSPDRLAVEQIDALHDFALTLLRLHSGKAAGSLSPGKRYDDDPTQDLGLDLIDDDDDDDELNEDFDGGFVIARDAASHHRSGMVVSGGGVGRVGRGSSPFSPAMGTARASPGGIPNPNPNQPTAHVWETTELLTAAWEETELVCPAQSPAWMRASRGLQAVESLSRDHVKCLQAVQRRPSPRIAALFEAYSIATGHVVHLTSGAAGHASYVSSYPVTDPSSSPSPSSPMTTPPPAGWTTTGTARHPRPMSPGPSGGKWGGQVSSSTKKLPRVALLGQQIRPTSPDPVRSNRGVNHPPVPLGFGSGSSRPTSPTSSSPAAARNAGWRALSPGGANHPPGSATTATTATTPVARTWNSSVGQRSIFPVHRTDLVQALVLTYLHRMHPATVRRLKSLFKGKDAILASRKEVVDALQSGQYTILYDTLRGALEVQLALVKRGSQKPVSDAATRAAQAAGLLSPPRARPGTAGGYEYVPSRVNTAWTTTAAGDGALALTSAQMPTAPPEDALLTCLREFRSSLNHPSAAGLVLAKALCVASDTAPVRSQDMTSGRIEFDYWQPAVALARDPYRLRDTLHALESTRTRMGADARKRLRATLQKLDVAELHHSVSVSAQFLGKFLERILRAQMKEADAAARSPSPTSSPTTNQRRAWGDEDEEEEGGREEGRERDHQAAPPASSSPTSPELPASPFPIHAGVVSDSARRLLRQAWTSLSHLNRQAVNQVRSMSRPVMGVHTVVLAAVVASGKQDEGLGPDGHHHGTGRHGSRSGGGGGIGIRSSKPRGRGSGSTWAAMKIALREYAVFHQGLEQALTVPLEPERLTRLARVLEAPEFHHIYHHHRPESPSSSSPSSSALFTQHVEVKYLMDVVVGVWTLNREVQPGACADAQQNAKLATVLGDGGGGGGGGMMGDIHIANPEDAAMSNGPVNISLLGIGIPEISELRAFRIPSPRLRTVFEAVCLLLSLTPIMVTIPIEDRTPKGPTTRPDYWKAVERAMQEPSKFLHRMQDLADRAAELDEFDWAEAERLVSRDAVERVSELLEDGKLDYESIRAQSIPAAGMAIWATRVVAPIARAQAAAPTAHVIDVVSPGGLETISEARGRTQSRRQSGATPTPTRSRRQSAMRRMSANAESNHPNETTPGMYGSPDPYHRPRSGSRRSSDGGGSRGGGWGNRSVGGGSSSSKRRFSPSPSRARELVDPNLPGYMRETHNSFRRSFIDLDEQGSEYDTQRHPAMFARGLRSSSAQDHERGAPPVPGSVAVVDHEDGRSMSIGGYTDALAGSIAGGGGSRYRGARRNSPVSGGAGVGDVGGGSVVRRDRFKSQAISSRPEEQPHFLRTTESEAMKRRSSVFSSVSGVSNHHHQHSSASGTDQQKAGFSGDVLHLNTSYKNQPGSHPKPIAPIVHHIEFVSRSDVIEIRTMRSPDKAVVLVMTAVGILLQIKPVRTHDFLNSRIHEDYWAPLVRAMLDADTFLSMMRDTRRRPPKLSPRLFHKLNQIAQSPFFDPEIVASCCRSATGMSRWVLDVCNGGKLEMATDADHKGGGGEKRGEDDMEYNDVDDEDDMTEVTDSEGEDDDTEGENGSVVSRAAEAVRSTVFRIADIMMTPRRRAATEAAHEQAVADNVGIMRDGSVQVRVLAQGERV